MSIRQNLTNNKNIKFKKNLQKVNKKKLRRKEKNLIKKRNHK
jgi:hypothetical protein